jgi:hypothetical protein
VVALTTRAALQRLSTIKYNPLKPRFDPPWGEREAFRREADSAMNAINVSFRPARKLSGALHEDTGLGPVAGKPNHYVHRVPLDRLTVAMVPQIRDPVIRGIVEGRCRECGIDLEGSGKVGKALVERPLRMPSRLPGVPGVPIKRVRIESTEKTAIPIRKVGGKVVKAVLPGGNHHLEIWKCADDSWDGRCVSRYVVHERLRKGFPVVDRSPGKGGAFLMSLCINDMMILTDPQTGEVRLYRVQKISAGSHKLMLRFHTAAMIDDPTTGVDVSSWHTLRAFNARKVIVDPVGRVLPCND